MAMTNDLEHAPIRYLGDMMRVEPEPDDVFVLTCPGHLNTEHIEGLRLQWRATMGDAKLIIFAGGMSLSVVNLADAIPISHADGGKS